MEAKILKTFNKNVINLLGKYNINEGMNYLLRHNYKIFKKLVDMGYRPDIDGIADIYTTRLRPYTENFEIIDLLPQNEKLDEINRSLSHFHPELIKEFKSRFSHRFNKHSIKSWGLTTAAKWDNYIKT